MTRLLLLPPLVLLLLTLSPSSAQVQPFRVSRNYLLNYLETEYVPGLCCEEKKEWCKDLADPSSCTEYQSCIGNAACDKDAMPTADPVDLRKHEFWCSGSSCASNLDYWCKKPEDWDRCAEFFSCINGDPDDFPAVECGPEGEVPDNFAQRWCDETACEIQFNDVCETPGNKEKCQEWLACETPTWDEDEVEDFCGYTGLEETMRQFCEPSAAVKNCASVYNEYCAVLDRASASAISEVGPDLKSTCIAFRICMGETEETAEDECEDFEEELPREPSFDPFYLLMCTCAKSTLFRDVLLSIAGIGALGTIAYYARTQYGSRSSSAPDAGVYQEIS